MNEYKIDININLYIVLHIKMACNVEEACNAEEACNVEEACNAAAAADYEQLFETTCILIQEYISLNKIHYMQPTFHSLIIKDVTSLVQQTLQDVVVEGIDKIIEDGMAFIYKHIVPPRSSGATFIRVAPKVRE